MEYLQLAKEAARKAGTIHKKYFNREIRIRTKSSSYDLLTIADTESERAVVSLIKKHFPEHNILAEEFGYRRTNSPYTWIIDPLDGTNNFASGLPIFCASVAVARGNQILAGAVYDVSRDELFFAQKGKGAYLNGKRIRVNPVATLSRSILITGFYYSRGLEMQQTLTAMRLFLRRGIVGLRRLGAAALDLCYVASGRAAGFWEFKLSPWDFAAGKLLVEEAGGRVSGYAAGAVELYRPGFIVASNSKIHGQMLAVLKSAYTARRGD